MNNMQNKKAMHPWLSVVVEILSARAGFYIQQNKKD